jgi:SAM-dependent methyltransferase
LRNWNEQKKAIKKLHELLAPGGRLLLLEGMKQGRDNLNKLRKRTGLSAMPKVWHNIDFDEKKLFPFLKNYFTVKQDIRFGLYDVLTRVYYPAYIFPKDARFRTKHHDTAVKMYYAFGERSCNEYSREACLILIKKETPAVK